LRHLKKTIKRLGRQAGYTLIEMLVVLAIMGLLTVGINAAITHMIRVGTRGTDSMTAIKQVENAFHWITMDVQQAQQVNPGFIDGFPLKLHWIEWDGTDYNVTYSIEFNEMKRSVSVNGGATQDIVIARYVSTVLAETNCKLPGKGTFSLPDVNDAVTLTGGLQASTGHITVTAGHISATTTGTATYSNGDWTTPHPGDTVVITATSSGTKGSWNADNTGASVALTVDADGDAGLTGNALTVTLTAYGGDHSSYKETRQGLIYSRS
jgi:prepilin-type N-terminal cleavage/methylation domain-containing protein